MFKYLLKAAILVLFVHLASGQDDEEKEE